LLHAAFFSLKNQTHDYAVRRVVVRAAEVGDHPEYRHRPLPILVEERLEVAVVLSRGDEGGGGGGGDEGGGGGGADRRAGGRGRGWGLLMRTSVSRWLGGAAARWLGGAAARRLGGSAAAPIWSAGASGRGMLRVRGLPGARGHRAARAGAARGRRGGARQHSSRSFETMRSRTLGLGARPRPSRPVLSCLRTEHRAQLSERFDFARAARTPS